MDEKELLNTFRSKVSNQIEIKKRGLNRFEISTPFKFDDGDHFIVILRKIGDQWFFTDEGNTYMHLSYSIDIKDLETGSRSRIISNTLELFNMKDDNGQLMMEITDDQYGDTLYSYLQALHKVSDITYLSRERVRSTFLEDMKNLIISNTPQDLLVVNWNDSNKDPKRLYKADYRVNSRSNQKKPILFFALNSETRTRDATINLLHYEKWGLDCASVGVFEDQENLPGNVVARFTDVASKTFSNISEENKVRIVRLITEAIN